MLRLDYFLMRRGFFSEGNDDVINTDGAWFIKSFTPRDNNGSKPTPNDHPVIVDWNDGMQETTESKWVTWGDTRIKSWKPDLEKLIEQQAEYDKQQKPIEELMLNKRESTMKFEYGQTVYLKGNNEIKLSFGCYHPNGETCLITYDKGYASVELEKVSSTPFKTKEELEIEAAKSAQIDRMLNIYSEQFNDGGELSDMLEIMQENGDLAEITMPLESKS